MFNLNNVIMRNIGSCNGVRILSNICKRWITTSSDGSVPLAYASYGEHSTGSPVIILHGLLGSKNNWHSLSRQISQRANVKVYAVDQRNHGESAHTDQMSLDLLIQDIDSFIQRHSFPKVTLIGHSLGGRAAIGFTLKNPHLVEKLVAVDISQLSKTVGREEIIGIIDVIYNLDINQANDLSEARRIAEKALESACQSKETRLFLCTNLCKGINGKFYWKFNVSAIKKNFEPALFKYSQPVVGTYSGETYFISGALSDYVVSEDEDDILANFPRAKFSYIEGAGHFVHTQKPHEFLDLVVPFLKNGPNTL